MRPPALLFVSFCFFTAQNLADATPLNSLPTKELGYRCSSTNDKFLVGQLYQCSSQEYKCEKFKDSSDEENKTYPIDDGVVNKIRLCSCEPEFRECLNKKIMNEPNYPTEITSLAQKLRAALWYPGGLNEVNIVEILTKNRISERLLIAEAYKNLYNEDLRHDLERRLTGDLKHLMTSLMQIQPYFYVTELHEAINNNDKEALLEILTAFDHHEIQEISNLYEKLYGISLTRAVDKDVLLRSSNLQRLLVALADVNDDTDQVIDEEQVNRDAHVLYEAGENEMDADEDTFIKILTIGSFEQRRQTFLEYKKISGKDLEETIGKLFSGVIRDALLGIVKCVKSKTEYFAELLGINVKGPGNNKHTLSRVIVSRSEIDLREIIKVFDEKFKLPLNITIIEDKSDYYQLALQFLISA